eukprot:Mrub_02605.p1 GENE.Mrub_02605~~Mrub_02605.p1  ORF type:complete len:523 (-),score=41.95 Mrub_02605:97-1602(-)
MREYLLNIEDDVQKLYTRVNTLSEKVSDLYQNQTKLVNMSTRELLINPSNSDLLNKNKDKDSDKDGKTNDENINYSQFNTFSIKNKDDVKPSNSGFIQYDNKQEEFDEVALNSLYSRSLYLITTCEDPGYVNITYLFFNYCIPYFIQAVSLLVLLYYYTNMYFEDFFANPFEAIPQGDESNLMNLISSPSWMAVLLLCLLATVYNMMKEYYNVCINLMMIDSFSERMPVTAGIAISLEISRTIFIYFAYFCNIFPIVFARNTMEMITENVVFLFILDFDNKLHKYMSGLVHKVKVKRSIRDNSVFSSLYVIWTILLVVEVVLMIQDRVYYHSNENYSKSTYLFFSFIRSPLRGLISIFPMIYSFKFVDKGHVRWVSILFILIWGLLFPFNILFVLGQALIYWGTFEVDWAMNSTIALVFQIAITIYAVYEAYWKPENYLKMFNEEDHLENLKINNPRDSQLRLETFGSQIYVNDKDDQSHKTKTGKIEVNVDNDLNIVEYD